MLEEERGAGFDDLMRDLEDNIFDLDGEEKEEEPKKEDEKPKRRMTLPTLVEQDTANSILKDFMKEKNQRKYDLMGSELLFKPYWFFTYTCELVMRDENGNIADSEEIGGRIAIDAVTGSLADYLQDLLDHEPIEVVDLSDEMGQVGGEAKIIEPKISENRVEHFVKQKISGALRADKENVSVAGFELMWSPVYRFWMTIKKRTHNVQIDGCGGYPVNYDDIPLKAKTWSDRLQDDIELLKNPKKWKEFLAKKGKAVRSGGSGDKGKGGKKMNWGLAEGLAVIVIAIAFLYALKERNWVFVIISIVLAIVLFWYMNTRRAKPLIPPPPPPYPSAYPEPPPQ